MHEDYIPLCAAVEQYIDAQRAKWVVLGVILGVIGTLLFQAIK